MDERREATKKSDAEKRFAQVCINLQRKNDPDFKEFVEWLVTQYAAASMENNALEGIPLVRSQGKAFFLGRLIEMILGAPDAMVDMIAKGAVRSRGNLGRW